MTKFEHILEEMSAIHNSCGALLESAQKLAASPDPKIKAISYEISIAVSKITHEQKVMLKEINAMQEECGALAD